MKKEHVFIGLMLVATVAGIGLTYLLYFKERFEEYDRDIQHAQMLEGKLKNLEETFSGFKPEVIVSEWRGAVQPWVDAVIERGDFFTMGDFFLIDPIPDRVMLKFYYQERSNEMVQELQDYIRDNYGRVRYTNPNRRFGAAEAGSYRVMNEQQVFLGLSLLQYGSNMVKMLLKAKATEISLVQVWPKRFGCDNLLNLRTTSLAFRMRLDDLVKFVEDLRTGDVRYWHVETLAIQNRDVAAPRDPELEVQMLLTQAHFVEAVAKAGTGGGGGGGAPAPGAGGYGGQSSRPPSTPPKQLTKWDKFVKWLKFNFWPF